MAWTPLVIPCPDANHQSGSSKPFGDAGGVHLIIQAEAASRVGKVSSLMISASDIVRNAIFEILDNQLTAGDPPETREALARLLANGHSEQEARRLIACVVASEVFAVVQDGRDFDSQRYAQALRALPKLPWDGPYAD